MDSGAFINNMKGDNFKALPVKINIPGVSLGVGSVTNQTQLPPLSILLAQNNLLNPASITIPKISPLSSNPLTSSSSSSSSAASAVAVAANRSSFHFYNPTLLPNSSNAGAINQIRHIPRILTIQPLSFIPNRFHSMDSNNSSISSPSNTASPSDAPRSAFIFDSEADNPLTSQITSSTAKKNRSYKSASNPVKCCSNCGATSTSSWRRDPTRKFLLCNACGLHLRIHGKNRKASLEQKKIVRRNSETVYPADSKSSIKTCAHCSRTESPKWLKGIMADDLCHFCSDIYAEKYPIAKSTDDQDIDTKRSAAEVLHSLFSSEKERKREEDLTEISENMMGVKNEPMTDPDPTSNNNLESLLQAVTVLDNQMKK